MNEKTKYNSGVPTDSTKLEQSEMSLAISDWAEGDEALREAITSCIDNSIPTFASCAGHSIIDNPYLTMVITPQNLGRILNIMNELSNQKGVTINLALQRDLEDQRSGGRSILTVYGNMLNKKQCFQSIADAARKSIKPDQASTLVQTLWDLHKASRIHGSNWNRLYNSISFHNGILSKRIDIRSNAVSVEFNDIIESAKLKKQKDIVGQPIYTKSSFGDEELIKKLKTITERIEETFIVNDRDEFNDTNFRGEFVENLKVEPNLEESQQDERGEQGIPQEKDGR